MLRLYRSYRPEHLLALLQRGITVSTQQKLGLTPVWVVVPHEIVADWLRFRLADSMGVCTAIHYVLPAQLTWAVLQETYPELPETLLADPKILAFYVDHWLSDSWATAPFPWLKRYLQRMDPRGRWQLASQLARSFDQYCLYRPDWMAAWAAGKQLGLGPAEDWQAAIWRSFVRDAAKTRRNFGQENSDSPGLGNHWVDWMAAWQHSAQKQASQADFGAIFFFGGCGFSPEYWRFLKQVASQREVAYFCWDPCREYWGDGAEDPLRLTQTVEVTDQAFSPATAENAWLELFHAQGRTGRFFLDRLQDFAEDVVAVYPEEPLESDAQVREEPRTLLHAWQAQMAVLAPAENREREQGAGFDRERSCERIKPLFLDNSLKIHATAGPMREVEVLYEAVIEQLSRNADWTAADVLVLVPDYATYLPYIHAVFGAATARTFPYSLAEPVSILGEVWLDWLRLPESRWSVEVLLDWFELPAIAACFGVAVDDTIDNVNAEFSSQRGGKRYAEQIAYLRRLIKAVDMRWGKNAAHKKEMGLPAEERHTVSWGLSRLWLGYAWPSASPEDLTDPYEGIVPVAGAEGDYLEVVLAWDRYLQALQDFSDRLAGEYTVADWGEHLRNGLRTLMVPIQRSDQMMIESLKEQIDDWQRFAALAIASSGNNQEEIRLQRPTILAWFEEARQKLIRTASWRGGTLFAPFTAAAGLPFKMVAILGLQDGSFPRAETRHSFDLLLKHPRQGDYSPSGEAQWLFLQAGCAAQEVLYLSYQGRDPVDGTTRPPAGVLAEWMQTIERVYGEAQLRHCCVEHPLQPFAMSRSVEATTREVSPEQPKYKSFSREERVWLDVKRYRESKVNRTAGKPQQQALSLENSPIYEEIQLEDLLRFFRNPARWFARRILQLNLPESLELIEPTEPLVGNGRLARQLQHRAMIESTTEQGIAAFSEEAWQEKVLIYGYAAGWLPAGEQGIVWGRQMLQATTPLRKNLRDALPGLSPPLSVDLMLAEVRLIGTLPNIGSEGLLHWIVGPIMDADYLSFWLQHLVLLQLQAHDSDFFRPRSRALNPGSVRSRLLGLEQEIVFPVVPAAAQHLERLMDWYRYGQKLPLPLFKDVSREWALYRLRKSEGRSESVHQELSRFGRKWRKHWLEKRSHRVNGWVGSARDRYESWIWRDIDPFGGELGEIFDASACDIWLPMLEAVEVLDY